MHKALIILMLLLSLFSLTKATAQSTPDTSVVMCPGDSAIMRVTYLNSDSIQWYRDGLPIFRANKDSLVTTDGGVYYVFAFKGGCRDESGNITVKIAAPVAKDDHYTLGLSHTEGLNIMDNDEAACAAFDMGSLKIITPPSHGTVMSVGSGRVMYRSAVSDIESDQFTYQLKDMDGHTTNTATVFIDIDFNCAMVYPNPVGSELNVIVNPKRIHAMNMYDFYGRLIYTRDVNQTYYKIQMGGFSLGSYMLELIEKNGPGCKIKVDKIL